MVLPIIVPMAPRATHTYPVANSPKELLEPRVSLEVLCA